MFYKKRFHFNNVYGYGNITYTSKDGQDTVVLPKNSAEEIRAITIKDYVLRINIINNDTLIRQIIEIPLDLLCYITITREKDNILTEIYDEAG